ncbi:hypothetical protein IA539_08890 [Gordonia sp. zg691]|uniref:hypothetical protein n=1 Tax=Gordonia jinghuaiqii TaxID=2758710 RepID=UPI0016627314|nr:hypothetical protein [Gordonia jinghuaiqii]MBD0861328.1 hypothetical protein [Gordonia jinghuaiqii]
MSTTVAAPADLPASADLSASSWASKVAAFTPAGVPDRDPRMRACRAALAYWRCRTVIDRERAALDPSDAAALQRALGPRGGNPMT